MRVYCVADCVEMDCLVCVSVVCWEDGTVEEVSVVSLAVSTRSRVLANGCVSSRMMSLLSVFVACSWSVCVCVGRRTWQKEATRG